MKLRIMLSTLSVAALCTTIFTGCPSSNSGVVFSRSETLQAQNVVFGTVIDVRAGKIEGTKSAIGAIAGGVAGAAVGNLFGGGKGNTIATVGGGLAGAAGGAAVEEKLTQKDGLQITVQLDNGQTVVIVQEADVQFSVNQRVRVLTGGGGRDRVQAL